MSMFQLNPAWLFASLVMMAASTIGLLSIWAGMGRRHWFLRLAAVGAVLALGIFVPAYDLVLLFFTQAAIVILTLFVIRGILGRREHQTDGNPGSGIAVRRPRFALVDLLLAMAVAGGISAVSAKVPKDVWADWQWLAILGASLGAVTLAAAWTALGRVRLLIRIAITCIVTASAGGVWTKPMTAAVFIFDRSDQSGWWFGSMMATAGVIILQLLLVRASRRATSRGRGEQPRGKPVGPSLLVVRAGQIVLGTLIVLPPAYTWYRLVTPVPIPDTSPPNPNAYEELVALASPLASATVPDEDAPVSVLRPFVAQYGPVLDQARMALAREWVVPVDYLSADHVERALTLRPLCRALVAEGNLAAHEGDMRRAVQSGVNCVQLGHAAARGGVVIDRRVGVAFEGIGISELSKIRHRLSAADCRELTQTLAALEATWEPLERVFMRNRAWSQHGWGWQGRLRILFNDLTGESLESQHSHARIDQRNRAFMQLLICDVSLRAFELEQGEVPGDLSQLVPEYLPAVPEDPFSGKPLIYRVQAGGHILYSIGPNRKDDGGRPDFDDGDIVLDMYGKPAPSSAGP
ncbi:MAG: hypothetical protein WD229_01735 [Pirellulales bacterium]